MPADAARAAALYRPRRVPPVPLPLAGAAITGAGLMGALVAVGSDYALFIVLGLLGLTLLSVLLVWPDLALPTAIFLIWTNVPTLVVDKGAPSVIAAAIPLILVAPLAISFLRGERLTIDRTFIGLLVLLGVFIASTVFGPKPDIAISKTTTLVSEGIVLYFLVFNAVRTPEMLRRATMAMLAAGSFLAAITVFQQLTGTFDRPYFGFSPLDIEYFLGKAETPRAYGPVGDPNYYAQILVVPIAVALPLLWSARGRARWLIGGGLGLMTLALSFTYSRGAMLALALIVAAMVVLGYLKLRHLAATVLVALVLVSLVPGYRDRVQSLTKLGGVTAQTGSSNEADDAARSRFTENVAAILVFSDYPVLGVGPGAFGSYYQEYAARTGGKVHRSSKRSSGGTAAGEAPEREAHNLFLSALAETGLVGLLALCAVFWTAFMQLARARRRWLDPDDTSRHIMAGLLLALLGYAAAGLFLSLAFERYLWLLVAMMGAAAFVARERAANDEEA